MNLPFNKDRVLSCLDGVLNNNTRLKVVTERNDGLKVCNFLNDIYKPLFPEIRVNETVINTETSVCLYTEDELGVITSTVSISWKDGEIVPKALMEEAALVNKNNEVTLQVGRFYIGAVKDLCLSGNNTT